MGHANRVAASLRAARLRVEDGWHPAFSRRGEEYQGEWRMVVCAPEEASEFCLADALHVGTDKEAALESEELLRPIVAGLWSGPWSADAWESVPGRTKAEVLALLAKGIARADALARTEAA